MNNNLRYIIVFVVLALIGLGSYLFMYSKNGQNGSETDQVMCASDVKLCPDGSYVPRVAPSCEFAACSENSSTTDETGASSTKSFLDVKQKVSFNYLDNFYLGEELTKYIHPVEWPPQISISTSTYSCKTTGNVISPDGKTETKTINGKIYCLTTQSEGAAGSVYTTYTYKIPIERKVVTISFIARFTQCANYDADKKLECEEERKLFSIDQMVDRIFKSVKFTI